MAITRAQQYRQMLEDGGMLVKPSVDGKRPGYRSAKAQEAQGRTKSYSSKTGKQGPTNYSVDDRSSDLQTYNQKKVTGKLGRQDRMGGELQYKDGVLIDETGRAVDDTFRGGFTGDLTENEKTLETFIDKESNYPGYIPGYVQFLADLNRRPNRKYFVENVLRAGKIPGVDYSMLGEDDFDIEQAYKDYMSNRLAGKTDAYGNPMAGFSYDSQGNLVGSFKDDDQPIIPLQTGIMSQAPGTTDLEPDPNSLEGLLANRGIAYRFMADGGMTEDAIGGAAEGDIDEMGRQMYGLGKLVKKATRAVKKIVKSPVGMAALGAYGLGLGPFASGKFGAGFLKSEGLKKLFLKEGAKKFALKNLSTQGILAAIGGTSALAGLLTQDEEEEGFPDDGRGPGLDIAGIRRDPYAAMGSAYGFYADGGDVKEPVAKKTMPLLDMGGMEKDYRKDGGFVPIGRMERADDVPARLSKNEFVFTADAVRNAGDGDIDKGAEVMYNMMKNLEAGGDVSEESQGLKGARNMFQTSQRLEEVL